MGPGGGIQNTGFNERFCVDNTRSNGVHKGANLAPILEYGKSYLNALGGPL